MTWAMATSMAVSVDGLMKMCSSATTALVCVTRGSTQTIFTPFFRAHFRYWSVPVPNVLSPGVQPHRIISFEFG